jgi:hypothetical protein
MGKLIMVVAVALTGFVLFARAAGRRTKPTPRATLLSDAAAVAKLEDEGAPLPSATT